MGSYTQGQLTTQKLATPAGADRGTVYDLWIEDTDNDTKKEIITACHYRGGGLWVLWE